MVERIWDNFCKNPIDDAKTKDGIPVNSTIREGDTTLSLPLLEKPSE
jgi:hypothetical protein